MELKPQQLEFPSLGFDKDRTVLSVREVADKWQVSDRHVVDLLEEGKLIGFDIAGKHDYIRVPVSAIAELAKMFKVDPQVIVKIINDSQPPRRSGYAFWRIPVKEGYIAFMKDNHSLNK